MGLISTFFDLANCYCQRFPWQKVMKDYSEMPLFLFQQLSIRLFCFLERILFDSWNLTELITLTKALVFNL